MPPPSSSDGTHLVAVVDGGGIYTSSNSGVTWTLTGGPSEEWYSVTSSSDGTHLVAVVRFGGIYINSGSTAVASGAQGSTATLQYLGNGRWGAVSLPQSTANAPNTAVTRDASGNFSAGTITATAFVGNGSGLTNLNAANLTGKLPLSTLPGAVITNNETGVTLSGTFGGNGAGLTNLNGANLVAGSVGTTQLAGGALAAPVSIASTSQTAVANTSYVVTNASPTTLYLPVNANIGDVVQITGEGAGGWAAELTSAWKLTSAPVQSWHSVASSSDGTHLVAVVAVEFGGGGIYTSTNSGATWTLTSAPVEYWQAVASSSDGTHLVAVELGADRIYTSTNSGTTWTLTSSGLDDWTTVASSSDGTHLVAAGEFYGDIYTSTNSGATWTLTSAPSEPWQSVASSSDGTHLVAVVYSGGIYTSTNSGATWTQTGAPGEYWYSVASSADGTHLVAVVYSGGICTSANSGATWTQTGAPVEDWWSVASSSDGTHLVAVVTGGGIYINSGSTAVASGAQGSTATLQYLGNGQWGAVSLPQSATNAPNTVVTRDASGNFSAGTITATAFVGNGSGLTNLSAAQLTSIGNTNSLYGGNFFIGSAGNSTTSGSLNTANGDFALYRNTSGSYNMADGYGALGSSTTGSDNTANGVEALYYNTTGSYDTANGEQALFHNTTGSYDTANGFYALIFNSTGNNNTANGEIGRA